MDWKILFNLHKVIHIFNWTPVAVRAPRPRYDIYNGKERVLRGYIVEVKYLYHGTQKIFFPADIQKIGVVSQQCALSEAINFYKKTKTKVSEYKKIKKNLVR